MRWQLRQTGVGRLYATAADDCITTENDCRHTGSLEERDREGGELSVRQEARETAWVAAARLNAQENKRK